MKIVQYDPREIKNVAEFLNKYLDEFKDDKYAMFVYKDVMEKAKDKEQLVKSYEALMKAIDLPYAFFPYYVHFNKVLPGFSGKPSPRLFANRAADGLKFDVVQEPSYGLLVVDLEKLRAINFKFNPKYKISFYIQDLIKKCFDAKLYFSKSFFIDLHNSWELFNDDFKNGYMFSTKDFAEEKKLFFETEMKDDKTQETINGFVQELKKRFGTPAPAPEPMVLVPPQAQKEAESK